MHMFEALAKRGGGEGMFAWGMARDWRDFDGIPRGGGLSFWTTAELGRPTDSRHILVSGISTRFIYSPFVQRIEIIRWNTDWKVIMLNTYHSSWLWLSIVQDWEALSLADTSRTMIDRCRASVGSHSNLHKREKKKEKKKKCSAVCHADKQPLPITSC